MRITAEGLDPREPNSASSQDSVASLPRIGEEPVVNFLDPPFGSPPRVPPMMKKATEGHDSPTCSQHSSTNKNFNLKATAVSTIKTAYDYLKASYQKLTSENSSILTASVISVKQRVLAASVEVSPITDNQIGMTSEDQHPVGHAASEKSASLSTTSIKVSQPYPANSALVPSSVSEVPTIQPQR